MSVDFTTSLTAALEKAADRIRDSVAKDGLVALKRVLDRSGFGDSEHLKDYEVRAHVTVDDEIEFEILLSVDSVRPEDSPDPPSADDTIRKRVRTFAMYGYGGVERVEGLKDQRRDARVPARDARKGAREARGKFHDRRRDSMDRSIEHQFAMYSPRNMKVEKDGKLAVMFKKSMKATTKGVQYPKGNFEGIVGKFVDELQKVIAEKFSPEIEAILSRYADG